MINPEWEVEHAQRNTPGLSGCALTVAAGNAVATPYEFTDLYDSRGLFNSFGSPALNDSGTVAFSASVGAKRGIFTGSGGATKTIVENSGRFRDFDRYSLNNSGTVAFHSRCA